MKEEAGFSPGPSSPPGAPVPELGWASTAIRNQPWHAGSPLGEEGAVPTTAALVDGLRLTRVGEEPLAGLREQQGVWGAASGARPGAQGGRQHQAPAGRRTAQRWPAGRGWAAGSAPARGTAGRSPSPSPFLVLCAPGSRMRDLALVDTCPLSSRDSCVPSRARRGDSRGQGWATFQRSSVLAPTFTDTSL